MNLKDGELHAIALIVAVGITAGLTAGVYLLQDHKPDEICDDVGMVDEDGDGDANCADLDCAELPKCLEDSNLIEASIAYKKEKQPKQPQKQFKEKEQEVKPEGISRDETAKVDDKSCKVDRDCGPKEECINSVCQRRTQEQTADTDPLGKVPDRRTDDDLPSSDQATEQVGSFDGEKYGVGDVTKGDPYFARLRNDLDFQPPELAKVTGEPVGCIRIERDGKISDTKFKTTSDGDLQPIAEKALQDLQAKRSRNPEEVPTHLLKELTTKWICFKFTAKAPE